MIGNMLFNRLFIPATALALVLAVTPALSQTPMDDPLDVRDQRRVDRMEKVVRELRAIVFQGRDSGKPVVVQPAETDFQLQALTQRVSDLEQVITRLNGQLETSAHDLDQTRRTVEQLRAENKALGDRMTVLEQRFIAPPEDAAAAPGTPPPPAFPAGEAFAEARQLMLNGDYDASERAWRSFVAAYPDHAKTPEAQYWYGKTLSARGAHADAAAAYIGAVRGWPQTGWGADATIELARELVALKKTAEACQTLGEFGRRYPKASAAAKSRAAATRTQAKCA